jgi:RNA polymerase sigma-70 factor (ECF subfamily)
MPELDLDSQETHRLLQRIKAGDDRAFDVLFARHRAALRHFIELRLDPGLRTRVDPSDVVQETQLEVFNRLRDFLDREPMPFRVWLRKTAYERLLKMQRHHTAARRAVGRETVLPQCSSLLLARPFLSGVSSPTQQFAHRELARRVQKAASALPSQGPRSPLA